MFRGIGYVHVLPSLLGQGARRWPFFVTFLSIVLLVGVSPRLYYSRLMPTTFGGFDQANLDVTLNQTWTYNAFGPDYSFEKAVKIFNCIVDARWQSKRTRNVTVPPLRECPSFFQFIHKDLAPWRDKGITREMLDMARKDAFFNVVILGGKLYVDRYEQCFGSRAVFTLWGLLLFLEKFRGMVPDLELVFNCADRPRIRKTEPSTSPPVLFAYNTNSDHFDLPFPDWSFWGWSEMLISPWDEKRDTIVKVSGSTKWERKVPMAFWSGNPYSGAAHRRELVKCHNATKTEIQVRDWRQELRWGKSNSKLEDQCMHRYNIYTEGNGWSVSLKYILACGSPTLLISPEMYDFFSRGLRPWVHYIPVRPFVLVAPRLCEQLDKGVEVCEANETQAVGIGKAGQEFMQNEISMDNVYSYMFHLLSEYAQLLTFQPSIEGESHLITLDRVLCMVEHDVDRRTLQRAMKVMPTNRVPCQLAQNPNVEEPDWEVKRLRKKKKKPQNTLI